MKWIALALGNVGLYDPAIPFLGEPNRYKYMCSSKDVYKNACILSSDTCYHTDESLNTVLTERSQSQKDQYYTIPLSEIPRIDKYIETERVKVIRGWEEKGMESYCVMSTEFPFEIIKNSGNG